MQVYKSKTIIERREELDRLTEQLKKGVITYVESDQYKEILNNMERFHDYSVGNSILIGLQKPDATYVASYTTWKKFNRNIQKGEKGIAIFSPMHYYVEKQKERIDPETGQTILDSQGNKITETIREKKLGYKVSHVFDVSQTVQIPGRKEYQFSPVTELNESVDSFDELFRAIEKISPVPVSFENIKSGEKGYYSSMDSKIVLQEGMSESQTIKTLIHEVAHSYLHGNEMPDNMNLSFYVAECSEFHSLGEFYNNLTLDEAIQKYKNIPSERMNGIKEIGCTLYKDGEWIGELPLVQGNKIQIDLINTIKPFAESFDVQKTVMDLRKEFADDGFSLRSTRELQAESVAYIVCKHLGIDTDQYSFGYVGSWMKDEDQLLENLNAIKSCGEEIITKVDQSIRDGIQDKYGIHSHEDMANRLDAFTKDFDLYEYRDQEIYKGSNYDQTLSCLRKGDTKGIEKTLKEIVSEGRDDHFVSEAKELMKCVQTFHQEKSVEFSKLAQKRGMKH